MSAFICCQCDNLRDADDGCEEGPNFGLICVRCMDENEAEAEQREAEEAEDFRRANPLEPDFRRIN